MKETRTIKNLWQQYEEKAEGKNRFTKSILWIFAIVAAGLLWTAKKMNLTYNAINVIVYYWIVPATWTIMIDWKIDCWVQTPVYTGFFPALTVFLCVTWVGILMATARFFNKWCDFVFDVSVDFLNYFNRWGGNYQLNSVIICVAIPFLIYLILGLMLIL